MKLKYTFFVLLCFLGFNQLHSQINCLNYVNVSLGLDGEAILSPDMLVFGDLSVFDTAWVNPNTFTCEQIGEHDVTVYGKTSAGLIVSCESTVSIEDKSAPIATVDQDITLSFNGSTTIELTPEMIDEGTYDNCGDFTMSVSPSSLNCFSTNPTVVVLTATDASGNSSQAWTNVYIDQSSAGFECADFDFINITNGPFELTLDDVFANGIPCSGWFEFNVTSSDGDVPADNTFGPEHLGFTYTVTVTNMETNDTCSFDFTVITGQVPYNVCVKDGAGVGIANVRLGDSNIYTDEQGCAVFNALPGEELTFSKESENLDGVDVEDLTLATKYILGEIPNVPVAALIAGDVNKNKQISTLDAVLIEKVINGTGNSDLPWLFYDTQFGEPNPSVYTAIDQKLVFDNYTDQTILAVKKGDLNFSADQLVGEDDKTELIVDDKALVEGEKYFIPFTVDEDASFVGLQLNLPAETADFKVLNVNTKLVDYSFAIQDGVAQLFWKAEDINVGTEYKKGEAIVEFEIIAKKNSVLHETLQLLKDKGNKQVLLNSDKGQSLKIGFDGLITVPTTQVEFDTDVILFPNPVKNTLYVDVNSNDIHANSVEIYNVEGRLLSKQLINSASTIDFSNVQTGMYLVNINCSNGLVLRRLIHKQ